SHPPLPAFSPAIIAHAFEGFKQEFGEQEFGWGLTRTHVRDRIKTAGGQTCVRKEARTMRITALSRATDDSSPGYRREARRACERRPPGRTPLAATRAAPRGGRLFGAGVIVLGLGAVRQGPS